MPNQPDSPDNAQDWDHKAIGWVADADLLDHVLQPFTDAIINQANIQAFQSVLDVGCGTGALLRHIHNKGARAVGVDISAAMIAAAGKNAPQAQLILGDAGTVDYSQIQQKPFDSVVSRFGTMFFTDPTGAFAHIRAGCSAEAEVTFVTWRADEHDMFTLGLEEFAKYADLDLARPPMGTPGPLGLADPDHIKALMGGAGWTHVQVTPLDGTCDFTQGGVTDGVSERMRLALNGNVGRTMRQHILTNHGQKEFQGLYQAATERLKNCLPDGVIFTGHAWLVTAINPV